MEFTSTHKHSQFFVGAPGQKITGALNDLDQYHPCTHRDPHPIGLIAMIAETDRQIAYYSTADDAGRRWASFLEHTRQAADT